MRASDLKDLLESSGIRPLRGRSQNFLLDERVVEALVEAAGVGPGSAVVEIGPGPGILTEALLRRGAEVVAVEIDQKLVRLLQQRFAGPALHLFEADVLEIDNSRLAAGFSGPPRRDGQYAVAANLPYAITSPVLEKFLLQSPHPSSMTLMVQREVADRILAGAGEMSSLAILVQSLGRPRRVCNVPRTAFLPAPKVDSAVIHIALKNTEELSVFFSGLPQEKYFSVVRQAFSQKRKQLKNTLKSFSRPQLTLENALVEAKIDPMSRPEELLPEQWVALVSALTR